MIRCKWYLTCRQGACGDGPCHGGQRPGWSPTGGLVREWGGASLECCWWELWAWLLKDTWYPHKLNVLVIIPYRIPGKWWSIGGGAHLGIQGGHNWRLWESPRRWNRRKWPSGLVDVPHAFICTACRISCHFICCEFAILCQILQTDYTSCQFWSCFNNSWDHSKARPHMKWNIARTPSIVKGNNSLRIKSFGLV